MTLSEKAALLTILKDDIFKSLKLLDEVRAKTLELKLSAPAVRVAFKVHLMMDSDEAKKHITSPQEALLEEIAVDIFHSEVKVNLHIRKKECPKCGGINFEIDADNLRKGNSLSFPDDDQNLLPAKCSGCGERIFLTVEIESDV